MGNDDDLVRRALTEYGLSPDRAHVRCVAESFNTVYRVEHGRDVYALRVGPAERVHAEGTEVVESRWMRDLLDRGTARVPSIVEGCDGEPVVRLACPNEPVERVCMMFSWVEGVLFRDRMSAEVAKRMGALAALMHESGPTSPEPTEPPLIADNVLYWKVENRLAELSTHAQLLDRAMTRAEDVLDRLWSNFPHPPRLLHGDLTPSNVLAEGDSLTIIDFQDLVWGFEVQDIAITFAALDAFPDAAVLGDAFRAGYGEMREWPDLSAHDLAALKAGRSLHQLNLGLTLRRPGLDEFIDRMIGRIERALRG